MLSFANPYGLIALLSIPVVLALHLFRRRYPTLKVAGLHLWREPGEALEAGQTQDRVQWTRSLLLELLVCLLVSFLISQPFWEEQSNRAHLVVVLDNSASMSATYSEASSGGSRVREKLKEYAEQLGEPLTATIVLTGQTPELLCGPEATFSEAMQALEQWDPHLPSHSPSMAWNFANEWGSGAEKFVYLTDHQITEDWNPPATMDIVAMGESVSNVAISQSFWEWNPDVSRAELMSSRVTLRIANWSHQAQQVSLLLEQADAPVHAQEITIQAGKKAFYEYTPDSVSEPIIARIQAESDALEIDNQVTLVPPQLKRLKVQNQLLESNSAFEPVNNVLQNLPYVELVPSNADLIIASGNTLLSRPANGAWVGIGPIEPELLNQPDKMITTTGPYLMMSESPLLEGVTLEGVVWSGVRQTQLIGVPIISVEQIPLMLELNGAEDQYMLNLDFRQSNLKQSIDWPILLSNLVSKVRDNLPGFRQPNLATSQWVAYQPPRSLPTGSNRIEVVSSGQIVKTFSAFGKINIQTPAYPGLHQLRLSGRVLDRFSTAFQDDFESNLRTANQGTRTAIAQTDQSSLIGSPETFKILCAGIAACLTLLLLNWYGLRPKSVN